MAILDLLKTAGEYVKNFGPAATILAAAYTWRLGMRERRNQTVREAYAEYIAAAASFLNAVRSVCDWDAHASDAPEDMRERHRRVDLVQEGIANLETAMARLLVTETRQPRLAVVERYDHAIRTVLIPERGDESARNKAWHGVNNRLIFLRALAKYLAAPWWASSGDIQSELHKLVSDSSSGLAVITPTGAT
jgi:hypothetical protein